MLNQLSDEVLDGIRDFLDYRDLARLDSVCVNTWHTHWLYVARLETRQVRDARQRELSRSCPLASSKRQRAKRQRAIVTIESVCSTRRRLF